MKRLLTASILLVSLIFVSLTLFHLPVTPSYSFFLPVKSEAPVKLVAYHISTYDRQFISELSAYTYGAHRGGPLVSNEPENSLPGYMAAKKLGYKIVETDLQLTKDGQWVIMHDFNLDRTTNGRGDVSSNLFKNVVKLKLDNKKGENITVPSLDEFLKLCSTENLIPILDIKPNENQITNRTYNSLLADLDKYHLMDKSIFCSYSKGVLAELRSLDNSTAIAVMMDVTPDTLSFTKKLTNAFIYWNYKDLTESKIDLINKAHLKFGVWTINEDRTAQYFLDKGAIIVVTDKLQKKYKNKSSL